MSEVKDVKVKICKLSKDKSDLQSLSKEDLIGKIGQLEAHVRQLRNLLKNDHDLTSVKVQNQRPFNHKRFAKRHVLLHIAYIGWDYMGFVVQEQTQKTIEAEIFKALEKTCLIDNRETSNYHRCGRTDKGVSSFGQVISIDLRSNLDSGLGVFIPEGRDVKSQEKGASGNEGEIRYAQLLNKVLPKEIRVIAWTPVSQSISARFDCQQRKYHYYFPKGNLNIENMRVASEYLIGQHDFRNLCKMDVGNGVVQFTRTVTSVEIEPIDSDNSSFAMYRITLVGAAFLWHQVRCIVVILFLVGQGKEVPTIIRDLLDVESNPRKPQYTMASELPLNLFQCTYPDVDEWFYDQHALRYVINDYQSMWTEHSVKSAMLKEILEELEKLTGSKIENQYQCLIQGVDPKVYTPLMKRAKCGKASFDESLEERIQHYAKRKRIEVVVESDPKP
nr:EOG090X083V [Sida crystallina]